LKDKESRIREKEQMTAKTLTVTVPTSLAKEL